MPGLLHQILDPKVAAGSQIALAWDGGKMDRATLRARVAKMVETLCCAGVTKGDRVLLRLPKGADALTVLFACIAVGAIAVPTDPNLPLPQLRLIAEVCNPIILVRGIETFGDPALIPEVRELVLDATLNEMAADSADLEICELAPDETVLILMTSGSTGVPKAVELTQRNILCFLNWAIETFALAGNDRFLNVAPLHFDLSIFDIMASQIVGAYVYLAGENEVMFPGTLATLLAQKDISVFYTVPTVLQSMLMFKPKSFQSLRWVLFAGEVMPRTALPGLRLLAPNADMANLYGPTETNVATWHKLSKVDFELTEPALPIGKACAGMQVTVRDETGQIVPDGVQGELCIEGSGIMRGYYANPEKTAASRLCGQVSSYMTGDFGWRDPNGTLHYAGRRDQRIKLRGNLVDLAEVEAVALRHPRVSICAAVVENLATLRARLVLYVVPDDADLFSTQAFGNWMSEHLTAASVPARIQVSLELPKMINGKIDKMRLTQTKEYV